MTPNPEVGASDEEARKISAASFASSASSSSSVQQEVSDLRRQVRLLKKQQQAEQERRESFEYYAHPTERRTLLPLANGKFSDGVEDQEGGARALEGEGEASGSSRKSSAEREPLPPQKDGGKSSNF